MKCDIKQFFASVDHGKLLNLLAIQIKDEQVLELVKEVIASFAMSPGKGIPLGNLTSQLFANVYMHELDFFVKHSLREKHYLRYCDDFVIVSPDLEHLRQLVSAIEKFLIEELHLSIHPHKVTTRKWSQGVDFLGYVLKPQCTLLRTKTKNRMIRRVNANNLTSYIGLCSHADSNELQKIISLKANW